MMLMVYLWEIVRDWFWVFPLMISSVCLYKTVSAFLNLKSRRRWRIMLLLLLGGTTGMVIWVGDNNLLFTLPVFFAVFLACSRGSLAGRIAVTAIFFCLIMPVNALLDTYIGELFQAASDTSYKFLYEALVRLLRPVVWGTLYFLGRKLFPEHPPRLSPTLWKLLLILSMMPFCSLLAVILLTYNKFDFPALYDLALRMGLAVLPFVFLTALALLYALLVLAEHERLKQADKLASLRESYYQGLQREEQQVRTIRHDLRNHLTAIQGLLERGESEQALQYLDRLSGSPALQGGRRLCENDAANAVLSAKLESLRQVGLEADFAVSLPKELPLDAVDLCALLGNALDNAQEAALQTCDHRVLLRCRTEKGLFMLRVVNAFQGPLQPDLVTSKEDKSAHGFGVPGMREIAERYGGALDIRASGGRFELIASLPLSQPAVCK